LQNHGVYYNDETDVLQSDILNDLLEELPVSDVFLEAFMEEVGILELIYDSGNDPDLNVEELTRNVAKLCQNEGENQRAKLIEKCDHLSQVLSSLTVCVCDCSIQFRLERQLIWLSVMRSQMLMELYLCLLHGLPRRMLVTCHFSAMRY
jgi:hypothetical protein